MNETLKVVEQGPVTHVVLNRPEVHNAFNAALIHELTRTFSNLKKNLTLRTVILRSEGRNFCAGGDMNWMKSAAKLSQKANEKDAKKLHEMFEIIASSQIPVISVVQGKALGGGVGLIAASDIVIAAQDAEFGLSEVRLGLIPSVIAPFVIRKIGSSHYNAYAIAAKRFRAVDALHMGLVHEISNNLDESTQRWIANILDGAPKAQREIKRFSEKIEKLSIKKAGAITSRMIAKVRVEPEAQEGLSAFLEKRKPKWS